MPQLTHRIPTVFEHIQDVASDTWVITHNLGAYPVIDIYVDYLAEKHRILPQAVTYNNMNTCTVTFSTPYTGLATVV